MISLVKSAKSMVASWFYGEDQATYTNTYNVENGEKRSGEDINDDAWSIIDSTEDWVNVANEEENVTLPTPTQGDVDDIEEPYDNFSDISDISDLFGNLSIVQPIFYNLPDWMKSIDLSYAQPPPPKYYSIPEWMRNLDLFHEETTPFNFGFIRTVPHTNQIRLPYDDRIPPWTVTFVVEKTPSAMKNISSRQDGINGNSWDAEFQHLFERPWDSTSYLEEPEPEPASTWDAEFQHLFEPPWDSLEEPEPQWPKCSELYQIMF